MDGLDRPQQAEVCRLQRSPNFGTKITSVSWEGGGGGGRPHPTHC